MNFAAVDCSHLWYGRWSRAAACLGLLLAGLSLTPSRAQAQSPSALYTWATAANVQQWAYSFGGTGAAATVNNNTLGELTVVETSTAAGASIAFSDNANFIREGSASNGGLDLTGLDWLEFDIGHNGSAPINVQFYTQAASGTGPSAGYSFSGLGPDLAIAPGVNTYQVPLTGLPADQLVYIRQFGVQVRDHAAVGNVTWTLREVRSGGTPLTVRDIITHSNPMSDGGLQGAVVNFDNGAVLGNDGQNQTGLSYNAAGTGSVQWTDVANGQGAAITWGNGTPWAGNGFNNRAADVSGYTQMIVRMSATDPANGGGNLGVAGFVQRNGFSFQALNGGAGASLPIDGQYHTLRYSLGGVSGLNTTEVYGVNVFDHPQNLTLNVDNVRFRKVSTQQQTLFSWESPDNLGTPGVNEALEGWVTTNEVPSPPPGVTLQPGHAHSIVTTGATDGAKALQIDRRSLTSGFTWGSQYGLNGAGNPAAQTQINNLVGLINGATRLAIDVTYKDLFNEAGGFISPSNTNFSIHFADGTGAFYQANTANIDLNHAGAGQTTTLEIPISAFNDVTEGSTKNLAVDGLSRTATVLEIGIGSNTDDGGIYQFDNFRLVTDLIADVDGDSLVGGTDFAAFKAGFGTGGQGDFDDDVDTDGADFLTWQRQFGAGATAVTAATGVPEPASCLLAALAAVAGRSIGRSGCKRPS